MDQRRTGEIEGTHLESSSGENGGTGPLALPNEASKPRGRRLFRLRSKVSLPTPS